jgi:general secretion pathway protein G
MKRCQRRGFTLVEVMVVLAILGLLISVALPRFAGRTEEARVQATRLQIENLSAAIDAFEFDCGRYPSTLEGLDVLRMEPVDTPGWKGPYMKKSIPVDPWKNAYVYVSPGTKSVDYDIYSIGPDRQDGSEDDIGSW